MATPVNSKSPKAASTKPTGAAKSAKPQAPRPKLIAKTAKSPAMAPTVVLAATSPAASLPKAENSPATAAKLRPAPTGDALKKKDLIDQVTAKTGAKKAMVRDIIEATLAVLGDALSSGAMLNLPPFGKAKVSRAAETGSGRAMTVKLRRDTPAGQVARQAKLALADAED